MFAYRGTSHRSFQVQAKLVSRTPEEATANAKYLNLIRSWVLPDFGNSGATPPIVTLTGYANANIRNLECFIRTYSWQFSDEVDYIFTGAEPMPVIGALSVDLEEIYSAREITEVSPWKIRNSDGTIMLATSIASLSNDLSFQGIATLSNSTINSLLSPITGDLMSIAKNPLTVVTQNSPQLTEAVKGIQSIQSNTFITGAPLGESAGVPTSLESSVSQAADSFGRSSLSNLGPTFNV
jgi:hypothetical protein